MDVEQGVCFCAAEGKAPAAPTGVHASETDRTYVVLSWKAPAYSNKAPMWYYIEKVLERCLHFSGLYLPEETGIWWMFLKQVTQPPL